MKKLIVFALVACMLLGVTAAPVNSSLAYSEDPLAEQTLATVPMETTAPTEAPVPETTLPP